MANAREGLLVFPMGGLALFQAISYTNIVCLYSPLFVAMSSVDFS